MMKEAPLELYLCRHGETAWTQSGQHTGTTDIPLTGMGRKQALLLGTRLKKTPFTLIFTSPLQRAKQTAQIAGFTAQPSPDLIEWNYGDYESLTTPEITQKHPAWNLFREGAPGGESPDQITTRATHFLHALPHQGKIAIFSHGHFLRVLATCWLGLSAEAAKYFALSVASLSILSFERKQPVIKLWNDTNHLENQL